MKTKPWRLFSLFLLALALVCLGCSDNGGNGTQEEPDAGGEDAGDSDVVFCDDDTDCPGEQKCRGGICQDVASCDCNYDCGARGDNKICTMSECVDGSPPDSSCSSPCECFANETCSGSTCVPVSGDEDTCQSDDDCDEGEACENHHCVPTGCATRDDCAGPECRVCIDGACAAPPPVCSGDNDCCVGFHCNFGVCVPDQEGCQSDADCDEPEFPRCIPPDCVPECTSDIECTGGKICREQHCVDVGCTPDSCDPGFWCNPEGGGGLGSCDPGCDSHDDCDPGQLCEYGTHQCVADCCGGCEASQYCDQDGGCVCVDKCLSDDDCPGGVCELASGECRPGGGQEFDPCTSDEDCGEGLLCDMCTFCLPEDKPGLMQCLIECAASVPCPRTDIECLFRRLDGFKWMCYPTTP